MFFKFSINLYFIFKINYKYKTKTYKNNKINTIFVFFDIEKILKKISLIL